MQNLRIPAFLTGRRKAETALNCIIAGLIVYFLCAVLLVFTAARYPRALMWFVRPLNHTWLPLLWLLACLVLVKMTLSAFRYARVAFTKLHWFVLSITLLAFGVFYFYTILSRRTLYFWDYRYYYSLQLELENAFQSDLREGFIALWKGLSDSDYTHLICLYTEFPFCLTDRSENAYLLSAFCTVFPAVLTLISGLLVRLADAWQIHRKNTFFVLGMLGVACFPLLHAAYLNGQPDVFGLVFALLILLLTQDYSFERMELGRLVTLFFATMLLILCRRWYLFWAVSYFACYALCVALRALRSKDAALRRSMLLRLLAFGAGSVLLGMLLLFPMVKRIFTYNYAKNYGAYYLAGGFMGEIGTQTRNLGYVTMGFMALGIIWGFFRAQRRRDALLALCGLFGGMYLFTMVQNMGTHQSLLLMPAYLILLFLGFGAVCSIKNKAVAAFASTLCGAGLLLNTATSVCRFPTLIDSPCVSSISLRYDDRADIAEVLAIDAWLLPRCNWDERIYAYMIPHGVLYNPDVFRAALLPDFSMFDILCYGFAVPGTHRFPAELLDAKYVLTCDCFTADNSAVNIGIAYRYNDVFLHNGYLETRFRLMETYDMPTGYTFYIYERIVPPDLAEVESYRATVADVTVEFPSMYNDVLDAYIVRKGLK